MADKMVVTTFTLPKELKELLEQWSQEEDEERSASYVVRKLIRQEATKRQRKQKSKSS